MAPLFITRYEWCQNDSEIHIRLLIRNVISSKTNIITAEKFLEINFIPYLFQLVLNGKVDPTKTKCIFRDSEVIVELRKSEAIIWDSLSQPVDNRNLVELKKQIILHEHENIKYKCSIESRSPPLLLLAKWNHIGYLAERDVFKAYLQPKSMFTLAIFQETRDRYTLLLLSTNHIEEICERKNVINTYQMNVNSREQDIIEQTKIRVKQKGFQKLTNFKYANESKKQDLTKVQEQNNEKQFIIPIPVPFPRARGIIQFIPSLRLIPSPRRASRKTAEEEWSKKKAESTQINSFVRNDLTEEERNPTWLLEKGMSFLKNDNFLGAINAFSYGSSIVPNMPIFYLRTAQTQLRTQQYHEAVENCNKAEELLQPSVENNKSMREETYRTRAAAYQYINEIRPT